MIRVILLVTCSRIWWILFNINCNSACLLGKEVMNTNGELPRDIFISEEDVRNMARKFAMESCKRDVNAAKMFGLDFENHDNVFFI